ncbi:hypothetical protein B0A69_08950 [Chryseobacterium shigense]|uniref:Uncharacterized protein n=1 Tax=Chryseobacterium shigense TaxID=297244 RepID=A0A1N7IFZ6_9FLAO|nr:hypothetical protein [Chryseobacterium shigense]PQA94580.1 hypothetical protein B0A69_08950 [Chryseobacterium shigense]SIS35946.1 hypothetical protein SAMN05421639_103577 [Chryseobacterium shigense]
MKSLYTIIFLAVSISIYAQENKNAPQPEDQAQVVRQLREHEAQLAKVSQENTPKKQSATPLASDQGLEVKKQDNTTAASPSSNNSGKLLPNTATIAEIKASIPNRQASQSISKNTNNSIQGLPNTATLEEIKKTIPKN